MSHSVNNIVRDKPVAVMTGKDALERTLLSDRFVTHTACGKLYKKQLFDGILYPEGRLFEDAATTYKLYFKSSKVTIVPYKYYNYFIRTESITTRRFNPSTMDKIKAADEIAGFVRNSCPELEAHASCFSTVTALRLAADFNKQTAKQYPEEFKIINARLRNDASDLLSTRHKCLLFLHRYYPPLFRRLWNMRLRKPAHS